MAMTKRTLISAAALVLLFAACGKDKSTNASTSTTAHRAAAKLAVDTRTIDPFGKVLTDADGMTLYVFDKDAPTKPNSACSGGCATTWPALTTSDGAGVATGLDASLLNHNAANQYTYNGWPLYRFSGDTEAGQTNGQGVGGIWHIAGADGNPVMTAAATTTTSKATAATTPAAKKAPATTGATSPPATSPPVTSPPATSPPTTAYVYPY
jgi:predicted lipoprotein with Yx(FWY)xxD motif